MKRILVSALLLGALAATPALAQGRGQQPPPPKGPAGPNPAVAIPADKEIPLAQALDAAQTAIDACLKLSPRSSAAVAMVVDLNGNIKVQLAADGVGLPFFDYARRKAYTVLKKRMPSGQFGALPEVVALGRGAVIEGDPELITFPGALPITKGGEIVGVLSVSGPTGGNDDLKCTEAGMAKLKL